MSWLQLDPQSVADRVKASGVPVHIPTFLESVIRGVIGFTLVSVAGFAPWALGGKWISQTFGEAGMYAACALVFITLSGLLLHRLIIGPGSLMRFYILFSMAFTPYAILWIVSWMTLRGHLGGIVGLFTGTAAMGLILAHAFKVKGAAPRITIILALFLLNAAGYFAGGKVEGAVAGMKGLSLLGTTLNDSERVNLAKLLWGVCYGIGLGAGLGFAFYTCQSGVRKMLANAKPADNL